MACELGKELALKVKEANEEVASWSSRRSFNYSTASDYKRRQLRKGAMEKYRAAVQQRDLHDTYCEDCKATRAKAS